MFLCKEKLQSAALLQALAPLFLQPLLGAAGPVGVALLKTMTKSPLEFNLDNQQIYPDVTLLGRSHDSDAMSPEQGGE